MLPLIGGIILLVILAILIWLLSARFFERIGGWIMNLFAPFKTEQESKEDKN